MPHVVMPPRESERESDARQAAFAFDLAAAVERWKAGELSRRQVEQMFGDDRVSVAHAVGNLDGQDWRRVEHTRPAREARSADKVRGLGLYRADMARGRWSSKNAAARDIAREINRSKKRKKRIMESTVRNWLKGDST